MAIDKELNEMGDIEPKLYELGFLLDPVIPEDSVAGEVAKICQFIEARGGSVESSGTPILRSLAYTVEISGAGKRQKYNQAHFCWVRFKLTPNALAHLEQDILKFNVLLRHLVLTVAPGSTTPAPRRYVKKETVPLAQTVVTATEQKVTEEDLDKEVDALIASTDAVTSNAK